MSQEIVSQSKNWNDRSSSTDALEDRRASINELIVAAYAGTSHEAPEGNAMRIAVTVWMSALDMAGVPTESLFEMLGRDLATRTNGFPPSVTDIAKQYRLQQAARPNKTIQQEDDERMTALPEGPEGEGRRAFLAHRALGRAIVCNCPPVRGYDVPAALMPDPNRCTPQTPRYWACATDSCDFRLSVEETAAARPPVNAGPNAGTRLKIDTEPIKATPNHSPFLTAFSADAGIEIDSCTPAQYVEFRQFATWYRSTYPGCKVNPSLLAELYPIFRESTAPQASYV